MVKYLRSRIAYYVYGKGNRDILCFHGYGLSGRNFAALVPYLESDFRLISIELPYHHKTQWMEERPFYASDLHAIILLIREQEGLAQDSWLLGYSIGGRVALNYFQHFPKHVKKIYLLAPDGLHKTFWYHFLAETYFGNFLLRKLYKSSGWALQTSKFCYRIRLINNSIYALTRRLLNDEAESKLLPARWLTLRFMRPDLKKIGDYLERYDVSVYAVFGKNDTIIPPHYSTYLQEVAPHRVKNIALNADHILLREPHVKEIAKLFYS